MQPPFGPIYPLSQKELTELRQYIDDNLKASRIRPSKSPTGAPILFVPKKDESLRLCIDYKGLNKVTIKNRYTLPLISKILDRVQGTKFFTKIDIKNAYYQIRIQEGDEWKTTFRSHYSHYEFLVMPIRLTNTPTTFQNYIHKALRRLVDVYCIVYLDDILIYSNDRNTHTKHIQEVLDRLHTTKLYAKPSKYSFYQETIEFLRYILSPREITINSRRIDTITQ